jgi:lysophospholipase L1-like esterase
MTLSWKVADPSHPVTPTLRLIGFGDSFVLGGGCRKRFAYQVAALIAAETSDVADLHVLGINGASYNYSWSDAGYPYTITQDISHRLVSLVSGTALPIWVLLQAGSNGIALAGNDAATEYSDFQTCLAAIVAAGIPASHIIVGTMLDRDTLNSIRTTFNSSLVSGVSTLGYKIANFGTNANIGAASANTNATYFQADAVHPNDAGAAGMARIFKDAMYA